MPYEAVKLVASNDTKVNLSDEAYAAFRELAASVAISPLTGALSLSREMPVPHPANLKAEEQEVPETLVDEQIKEMLGDSSAWKLAIPNGLSFDVLTRSALKQAVDSGNGASVTKALRGATLDEAAALEDAKERLSPKAGAARYTAALGAPVTNIALLAAATGGFLAVKGDEEVARPGLLLIAIAAAVIAVSLSIAGNLLVRHQPIHLARLDLLQSLRRPSLLLPNACVLFFLVAIVSAPFSIFPAKSSSPAKSHPPVSVSFSPSTTTTSGRHTKLSFEVSWKNLGKEVTAVRTTVRAARGKSRTTTTPRVASTVVQHLGSSVRGPTTVSATTRLLVGAGKDRRPSGNLTTHEYEVPR